VPDLSAWTVVIGAAIGASGAVVAQVIAAMFTARRETSRLRWEQERQAREWKIKESERFLELKQQLYTRLLSMSYNPVMDVLALTRTEYIGKPGWQQSVPEYVGAFQEEIDRLRWNIRLVGSHVVSERVEVFNASLLVALSEAAWGNRNSIERRHEFAELALRAWQDLSNVMRSDLAGDEEALARRWKQITERSHSAATPVRQGATV
jgi:hypothetical protein